MIHIYPGTFYVGLCDDDDATVYGLSCDEDRGRGLGFKFEHRRASVKGISPLGYWQKVNQSPTQTKP